MSALVVIILGASPQSLRPDEREGHEQALAISESVQRLGLRSEIIKLSSDLSQLTKISAKKPLFVFNLVEEIEGQCRLSHLAPAMLEILELPFSGASALNISTTSNKVWTKHLLKQSSLPTPSWSIDGIDLAGDELVIIKSVFEDASFGIDDRSVMKAQDAAHALTSITKRHGGAWFAEKYIEGREFNLSLLAVNNHVLVLPIIEIIFTNYPPNKPRIMDYDAKWTKESFAFMHTARCFIDDQAELKKELSRLATTVWNLFGLKGYARVDFRVDAQGNPYILEINANPSLAADSSFMAAANKAGYSFDDIISLMIPRKKNPDKLKISWRENIINSDLDSIRQIVSDSGFFNKEEIDVAVELAELNMSKGDASGYLFIIAESAGQMLGYACYGRIMGTQDRYDIYWIAVVNTLRRQGLGAQILARVEEKIKKSGGRRIYLQTAGRPFYEPTRNFYDAAGYTKAAELPDYYSFGDDLVIFMKELG